MCRGEEINVFMLLFSITVVPNCTAFFDTTNHAVADWFQANIREPLIAGHKSSES